jgi:DNA polymerase-3 subunit epsilon
VGIFSRKPHSRFQNVDIEDSWPFGEKSGFVVFDIETTGLSPTSDRMIEIGLIRTDNLGNPLAYWSSLINPKQPVGATEIHGLSDKDVQGAPTFDELFDQIRSRIHGQALSAHNAQFDIAFLRVEFARAGWDLPQVPVLCTMQESRHFIPGLSKRRLQDCVGALGIEQEVEHRALSDASLTTALVNFYLNGPTNKRRSQDLAEMPGIAGAITWPESKTFPTISNSGLAKQQRAIKRPSTSELLKTISSTMPEDLLGDDAPLSDLTYAQVLLEAMEDGEVTKEETSSLADLAESLHISSTRQDEIHTKLMSTLAQEAWRDGVVSKTEQSEIIDMGNALGFTDSDSKRFMREVEELRASRIGARAKALPADWSYGQPLHVGDRVVITGCYDVGRDELETKSRMMGIRITGSVSGKTVLLVSDGTINGNKDADAARLGIRSITPDIYRVLLDYVQPANQENQTSPSSEQRTIEEVLVCTKCAGTFTRIVSKGRKPHLCPSCRQ